VAGGDLSYKIYWKPDLGLNDKRPGFEIRNSSLCIADKLIFKWPKLYRYKCWVIKIYHIKNILLRSWVTQDSLQESHDKILCNGIYFTYQIYVLIIIPNAYINFFKIKACTFSYLCFIIPFVLLIILFYIIPVSNFNFLIYLIIYLHIRIKILSETEKMTRNCKS
jgi:hypothetical protein